MLKFLFEKNKTRIAELDSPLYFNMNIDEDIPADDISVTFSGAASIDNAELITVRDDGRVIFSGIIDEIRRCFDGGRLYTKVNARSMAAALLDNESRPVSYSEVSTSVIFLNHLKPFGLTAYTGADKTLFGGMNVAKGSTNWQVFYTFCSKAFGKKPRINPDGTADFEGINSDKALIFSNKSGINYNSIKENKRLCKSITRVYSKLTENGGYSVITSNPETAESSVRRERFIDESNRSTPLGIAKSIINNSNKQAYVVTLNCPGRYVDILGAKAAVEDELLGKLDSLRVSSLYYSLTPSGDYTSITLKRGQANVDT